MAVVGEKQMAIDTAPTAQTAERLPAPRQPLPPGPNLTRWRMTLAAKLLAESNPSLQTLAARTGYGNEFAFAKAFKREFGVAPGQYRRDRQAASATRDTRSRADSG